MIEWRPPSAYCPHVNHHVESVCQSPAVILLYWILNISVQETEFEKSTPNSKFKESDSHKRVCGTFYNHYKVPTFSHIIILWASCVTKSVTV